MILLALSSLVALASAQLQCHPETLTYNYENEIKLWGSVEQSYHVTCTVDIDCEGVSDHFSDGWLAFDFVAHIDNVVVKEGTVRPENVRKLCKSPQNPGGECSVGEEGDSGGAKETVVRDNGMFSLPVRFTQTQNGRILRIQFMEKDFENPDVINMKKGIISTLQTRMSGREEKDVTETETDVTGTHNAHYSTEMTPDGSFIRKEYSSRDESIRHSFTRQAETRVYIEASLQNGELVDSRGETRSQIPDDEGFDVEVDPDDLKIDIDVDEVLSSTSQFDMKLKQKTKRSASRQKRLAEYKSLEFLPSSLAMDMSDKTESKYQQLELLYGQLKMISLDKAIQKFLVSQDENDLKLIKQIIMLETDLGFEQIKRKMLMEGAPLVDILVSATYGLMGQCGTSWDTCREVLELYSLGGRRRAEEVFEFMLSGEGNLTKDQQLDVINIASFMVNPSDNFVITLVHLLEKESPESEIFSSLLLGLGTLAGHHSVSETTKHIVSAIFLKELEDISPGYCPDDVRHADALEAIGNMGDKRFLDRLMDINAVCENSTIMRVALIHAMRGYLDDDRVQGLLIDTLFNFDCDVSQNMLNLLLEIIQEQQLQENELWPLVGFNEVDQTLKALLVETDTLECLRKDAIHYFKDKLVDDAQELVKSLSADRENMYGNETIAVTKRGIKKHSSCTNWNVYGGRYKDILSAASFNKDKATYNKRSHCLGHFRIGASKAAVNIYAGYFAGYKTPVSSEKKKLFAKAVANGKIFKKSFSIGTVLLYFQANGKGKTPTGRIYARIAGKTLIDARLSKASYKSTKTVFSKSKEIRLGKIPIYIITINIDLVLSAKIEVTTHLRLCNTLDLCLTYTPRAIARASVSASVSLGLVRGGADLGVNLNYYVAGEGRVRLKQHPCIRFSHGADKNSISLQFWYQIRSKIKIKFKWWPPKFKFEWKWGGKKTWKPSSLKWSISKTKDKQIYSNCDKKKPSIRIRIPKIRLPIRYPKIKIPKPWKRPFRQPL